MSKCIEISLFESEGEMVNFIPLKNKGNKKTYLKVIEIELDLNKLPKRLYHWQGRTIEVFETKDLEVWNRHGYISNILIHADTKTTFGQILNGELKPISWVATSEEQILKWLIGSKPIRDKSLNPNWHKGNMLNWEKNMEIVLGSEWKDKYKDME